MKIAFYTTALNRIKSSIIGKRLAIATFWSLLGGFFSRGLAFASFIIVARVLGKELLGELAIIQSTTVMVATFAIFGLSLTASKHVAEYKLNNQEKTAKVLKLSGSIALFSGILFSGSLVSASSWLSLEVLAAPHLASLLQISSIMLFFLALDGAQVGALTGFEAFKVIAKINLIKGVISFSALVIGVYVDGLRGVTIALVISSAIGWFLNRLALNREIKKHSIPSVLLQECRAELRLLWRFSLPSAISGMLIAPTLWICFAMLANEPEGYQELGLYDIANRLYQIMIFLGVSLGAPLLPILANPATSSNTKIQKINVLLAWGLGLIPIFPLMLFPDIIEFLFGDNLSGLDLKLTVAIMLLASSLVLYKQGLARALAIKNLLWWGVLSNLFWVVLMLVFSSMFVSNGSVGLGAAVLLSYVLNTVVVMPLYLKRKIVPKETMLSFRALVIWCITVFPVYMIWQEYSIMWRGLYLLFGSIILILSFWGIFKSDS